MKRIRTIYAGVLAGAVGMICAAAQAQEQGPAEIPPMTYEGKQYVDSRGCVFIRAGIDGDVTWVPRVTRARTEICGFEPTQDGAVAEAAPAPAEMPQRITRETTQAALPEPQVRRPPDAAIARPALIETARRPVKVSAPAPAVRSAGDDQTLAGSRDMLLAWTQTAPRRLIDTRTGRDVTASVPLVYPYLDVGTQRRELGEVRILQRDGKVIKHIQHRRKPIFSSRSEKPAAAGREVMRATGPGRYVQVGTYRVPANARATAQRVAAMGMPARIAELRQGGTTYLTVSAGPFDRADVVRSALHSLRGAGYADAFTR